MEFIFYSIYCRFLSINEKQDLVTQPIKYKETFMEFSNLWNILLSENRKLNSVVEKRKPVMIFSFSINKSFSLLSQIFWLSLLENVQGSKNSRSEHDWWSLYFIMDVQRNLIIRDLVWREGNTRDTKTYKIQNKKICPARGW